MGSRDAEVDGIEGLLSCQPLLNESSDVLDSGRDGPREFVHVASTGVVVDRGVNDEGAGVLVVLGLLDPLSHPGHVWVTAIEGRKTDRVQTEIKRQLVSVDLGLNVNIKESLSSGLLVITARDLNLGQIEQHILEVTCNVRGLNGVSPDPQPQGRHATLKVGDDGLFSERDIGILVKGPDIPCVHAAFTDRGTTSERRHARNTEFLGGILTPVHRLDLDAVDRSRLEALHSLLDVEFLALRTTPVQNLKDRLLPLLVGDLREVPGQAQLLRHPVLDGLRCEVVRISHSLDSCSAVDGWTTSVGPRDLGRCGTRGVHHTLWQVFGLMGTSSADESYVTASQTEAQCLIAAKPIREPDERRW
ncbi:hypothetical protein JCM18920_75 [Cutibacterium acnes JCM 18920]|nr:hypothetical protein JCM18920_75 [Cutibacterium acnes JCM 18920]